MNHPFTLWLPKVEFFLDPTISDPLCGILVTGFSVAAYIAIGERSGAISICHEPIKTYSVRRHDGPSQ